MPTRRQLGMLLLIACLVAAQLHVWADLDPCLWKPNATHRAGHNSHACQGCASSVWTISAGAPGLALVLWSARLEIQTSKFLRPYDRTEVSAPRAPPA